MKPIGLANAWLQTRVQWWGQPGWKVCPRCGIGFKPDDVERDVYLKCESIYEIAPHAEDFCPADKA